MTTALAREIAELKAVAEHHAARHEHIEGFHWPDGVRIAVNFTADFDAMLLRRLHNEPPMQLAKGEFGGRVGIWRLIGDSGAFLGPTVVGVIAGLLSLQGSAWVLSGIGVAAALTLALLVRETRIDPAVVTSGEPVAGRS